MGIAVFGIVVDMRRTNLLPQNLKRLAHGIHHVRMPEIEANPHIVKMSCVNQLHQSLRRGKFVGNIFQQNAHTQRLGKCAQVFDGGHRRFKLLLTETFVGQSQMLHQKAKRNLLRDLQGPFHLIHRLDQPRAVRRRQVYGRRSRPAPLVIGIERRVHGIQRNATPTKPLGDLFHVSLAIGIVEMLTRCENLDRLHSAASQPIQDSRMQPLLDVQIG